MIVTLIVGEINQKKDRKCEFRNPGSSESPVLIEEPADFQENFTKV